MKLTLAGPSMSTTPQHHTPKDQHSRPTPHFSYAEKSASVVVRQEAIVQPANLILRRLRICVISSFLDPEFSCAMKQPYSPSTPPAPALVLKRQAYYCEENAWHLCQEPFFGSRRRHILFISNAEGAVPMWNQRAGQGKPIVWDYHVIVLAEDPIEIWDVDTLLGIPITLHDYLAGSFHPEMPDLYQPAFRVVRADIFLDVFSSDRSHMRRRDGSYRKPPPSWPMLKKPGVASNLMQFVDFERPFIGDVMSLAQLQERFGNP